MSSECLHLWEDVLSTESERSSVSRHYVSEEQSSVKAEWASFALIYWRLGAVCMMFWAAGFKRCLLFRSDCRSSIVRRLQQQAASSSSGCFDICHKGCCNMFVYSMCLFDGPSSKIEGPPQKYLSAMWLVSSSFIQIFALSSLSATTSSALFPQRNLSGTSVCPKWFARTISMPARTLRT